MLSPIIYRVVVLGSDHFMVSMERRNDYSDLYVIDLDVHISGHMSIALRQRKSKFILKCVSSHCWRELLLLLQPLGC